MGKIKLKVLGISYSQTQSGAYALVLGEENGDRRIPIIIGGFEAQAIAIQLEGLKPPRPLTHDLFLSLALAYNINLEEIYINRLESGVFYCELVCNNQHSTIKLDARTSDSIALALRFNCPIYTTTEILDKAGIIIPEESEEREAGVKKEKKKKKSDENQYAKLNTEELESLLNKAIEEENYEIASLIKEEIKLRKETS
ncbi:MAG: bifunctional nuclease family protein [Salinivirgaceae bacterium]|nr:bifunctional nuclease family protein [Salinivirgaceae bacterium]MDD4746135.1 bifunctional nuclease family protein [Salinivirgaceae bacterium]MDY0279910.1 bifunctional nuclease family protein [Salinivirgaceae bacterium]